MVVLVSAGVAWRNSAGKIEIWMQLRQEAKAWEFPGGKIEAGESPAQALVREWDEEVKEKLTLEQCQLFGIYPYQYPNKNVSLNVFLIAGADPRFGGEWYDLFDVSVPILGANNKIIEDLKNYFRQKV